MFPVPFSLFHQDCATPYIRIFGKRDSRQQKKFPPKRKNAPRIFRQKEKMLQQTRVMVGNNSGDAHGSSTAENS